MHVSTYYYFIIPIIYLYIYKKYKPPEHLFASVPMALNPYLSIQQYNYYVIIYCDFSYIPCI